MLAGIRHAALARAMMPVLVLGLVSATAADTLRVPADFPTIQAAIDAARDGDVVLVADGTYSGEGNTQLVLEGRAITVRSENGPAHCVIDGQGTALVGFSLTYGEGPDTVVEGFTLSDFCGS